MRLLVGIAGLILGLNPVVRSVGPGAADIRVTYLGQDGNDYCTTDTQLAPNDIQDLHLRLEGLPSDQELVAATFTRLGGGAWSYANRPKRTQHFRAALLRRSAADTADVFLEPTFDEAAFELHIELEYASGQKAEFDTHCGRSDPNRFMPNAVLEAHWVGQEGHDLTGPTAAVGPDGLQDARIEVTGLSKRLNLDWIRIDAEDVGKWECGPNREGRGNAELAWYPNDISKAALFFSPRSDLNQHTLTLRIRYANGRQTRTKLKAGTIDPGLRMPDAPEVLIEREISRRLSVKWEAQATDAVTNRGDLHLELNGLPEGTEVLATALSDHYGGYWVSCRPEAENAFYPTTVSGLKTLDNPSQHDQFGLFRIEPFHAPGGSAESRFGALPLRMDKQAGANVLHLHFPPFRDEESTPMLLRILFRKGKGPIQTAICSFAGKRCDPFLRGTPPSGTAVRARPSDSLDDLILRYDRISLSPGRYVLAAPLTLNKPVAIIGSRGAILEFSQPADTPEWSEAIRLGAANVTLEGFNIRFAGPVRWRRDSAVFRALPATKAGVVANLLIQNLEVESAPVLPLPEPGYELPSIFLMNLGAATSGRIVGNTFRGGTIDVMNGPWEITDNKYLGAMPGTVAWDAFGAHYVHDLTVGRNQVVPTAPCGKTWRFLVITQRGENIRVFDNKVENIGMKDTDKLPNPNAPEIMLTESYRLNYEGYPARISAAGWVLQVPFVMYWQVEPGCMVSVLSGTSAGRYFRIAQPLSPTAFLLERPMQETLWKGNYAISIAHGFTDLTWEGNTVDARGGGSSAMVLAGNHWNVRLVGNHLLGGSQGTRIEAGATECPGRWGWSRTPILNLLMERNALEDCRVAANLTVSEGAYEKTSVGRTYLAGSLSDNIIRWSEPFMQESHSAAKPADAVPKAIRLNVQKDADPHQMLLQFKGNRLEAPGAASTNQVVTGGSR